MFESIPSTSTKYLDSKSTDVLNSIRSTNSTTSSKLVSPSDASRTFKSGYADTIIETESIVDLTEENLYDQQQHNSSIPLNIGKAFFF